MNVTQTWKVKDFQYSNGETVNDMPFSVKLLLFKLTSSRKTGNQEEGCSFHPTGKKKTTSNPDMFSSKRITGINIEKSMGKRKSSDSPNWDQALGVLQGLTLLLMLGVPTDRSRQVWMPPERPNKLLS